MVVSRTAIVLVVIGALLGVVPGPRAAAAAPPQVWTTSSYENVFQDAVKPAGSAAAWQYVVARNEYESFQILTRSTEAYTITGVDFSALTNGTQSLAAADLSYNFVEYAYSSANTPLAGQPAPRIRNAPAQFPDPLSNATTMAVPANSTQPIWITLYVPKDAVPGTYAGTATVRTGAGDQQVSISAEVAAVTVPDPSEGSFTTMNHQQIAGTWFFDASATSHPNDVITRIYGHERWTPQWWSLVDDMAAQMRRHRVNSLFVNTQQLLLDGGTTLAANKYTFQWARFDEYIQRFIDAGVVKQLEGVHFGSTIGAVGEVYRSYILTNSNGEMRSTNVDADSAASDLWLEQFVPELYKHLVQKKWLGLWYQHIGDEMLSDLQKKQYAHYMSFIKDHAPGIRSGDPTFSMPAAEWALQQGTNVTVPTMWLYENVGKAAFDQHIQNGKLVYAYNAGGDNALTFNRWVDWPVWHGRNAGWVLYKYGLPGYLHWAWNFWIDWNDPDFTTLDEQTFKGDHYIVYPDVPANRVRSTIRFEAMRDMAEDYELLNLAGRQHQQAVTTLINSVATEFDTFSTDTANMIRKRAELVRLAASPAGNIFTNPIGDTPNPVMAKAGGKYFLAGSEGNKITIRTSASLPDVARATPEYVHWASGMSDNLWVSDLKYLNGRWYLYFTGDARTHVLEGGTDPNDPLSGAYAYKARLFDSGADITALSGSVLVHNGSQYFVWSGAPAAGSTAQHLYIAPLANPYTLSGTRIEIANPTLGWEESWLDSPTGLVKDGRTHLVYSAGNSGSDRSQLGILTLTGANPLLKASWTKSSSPAFASGDGVFGPGAATFTTSPDGKETWMMYHARRSSGSGYNRTTWLQRVQWSTTGAPRLGVPYGAGQAHAVPAGTPLARGVYEAEEGVAEGGARVGYESQASRKTVVYGIDAVGASVSVTVNVAKAGQYLLAVRNATGYNGAGHNVYVNGVDKGKLNYPNLGWNRFSTVGMLVSLNAGNNVVKFAKDKEADAFAEIDYVAVDDRLEGEDAVLTSAIPLAEPQASGSAEAAGIDTAGSTVEFFVNVPAAGQYQLETVNSTAYAPASHLLFVNGSAVPDANYVNNGWGNFSSPASNLVSLRAGNNVIRYQKSSNYAAIDHIKLRPLGHKYEAEDAVLANGASIGTESAASGGRVAWGIDAVGPPASVVTFKVTAPAAGTYTAAIRAASGWTAPNQLLTVNGQPTGPIPYAGLGWNRFTTTPIRLRLNVGENTIALAKGAGAGTNTAELDYLEISP